MTAIEDPPPERGTDHAWDGLRELDRAIAEDRLTAYRWKKAWADPLSRAMILIVLLLLAVFAVYVVIDELVIRG